MTDRPGDVIDVRTLPKPQRHVLIFGRFDALRPGEAIEIVNDHDPVGLLYGFNQFYPGGFTWDYLEQGPVDWHVRIGREAGAPAGGVAPQGGCACGSTSGGCG